MCLRDELCAATGLKDKALDQLIVDLKVAIDVYRDHTSDAAQRRSDQVAAWYAKRADECERRATVASEMPVNVCAGYPSLRELQQRAVEARVDARLNALDNPSHRPPWKGECRDYLARTAREIIERHCGVLTLPNLRRGIAAVLDEAGAAHDNPKKNSARFDKTCQADSTHGQ